MFASKSYGEQMKEEVSSGTQVGDSCSRQLTSEQLETSRSASGAMPGSQSTQYLPDPWLERLGQEAAARQAAFESPAPVSAKSRTGPAQRRLWNNMACIPEIMLDSSINFRARVTCTDPTEGDTWEGEQRLPSNEEDYRALHERIASRDSNSSPTTLL